MGMDVDERSQLFCLPHYHPAEFYQNPEKTSSSEPLESTISRGPKLRIDPWTLMQAAFTDSGLAGAPSAVVPSLHTRLLGRLAGHAPLAEPDLGFMAWLMAVCSLPRTNPGRR